MPYSMATAVPNAAIGRLFSELADLLEIEGANPFRVRAYRNAARVVSQWPQSLSELLARGDEVPKLPGLGNDLRGKVVEIAATGELSVLQEVRKRVPPGLSLLLNLPGLGPKRVLALKNEFQIRDVRDLEKVIRDGRLRELRGFGPKIEARILEELSRTRPANARILLFNAEQLALPLLKRLKQVPGVRQAAIAGSYRRRQETLGDLDILVAVAPASGRKSPSVEVMDRLVAFDEVERVLARGPTKCTVALRFEAQLDLRVVPEESFGAALHYFTGSKAHNINIRMLGVRRGLKINEYGIFKGSKRIGGRTEEEVFRAVDLPLIPPELREARGEIEAAQESRLPKLVTLEDIRGDLHAHTRETDGQLTLEELAAKAEAQGYEYLAITDHSRRLAMARGLDPERLAAQIRAIDRFNARSRGLRLLKGCEVDILEDGSLDLPEIILRQLDLTVCSVHSHFNLPEKRQTERILRAMDHPSFTILGHPTGRLLNRREPYPVDMERVLRGARDRGCFVEVNSQPDRLDLRDLHCRMACDLGVLLVISTDTHQPGDLGLMRYGVDQARRGWLEARQVVNTRGLRELRKLLARRRSS